MAHAATRGDLRSSLGVQGFRPSATLGLALVEDGLNCEAGGCQPARETGRSTRARGMQCQLLARACAPCPSHAPYANKVPIAITHSHSHAQGPLPEGSLHPGRPVRRER